MSLLPPSAATILPPWVSKQNYSSLGSSSLMGMKPATDVSLGIRAFSLTVAEQSSSDFTFSSIAGREQGLSTASLSKRLSFPLHLVPHCVEAFFKSGSSCACDGKKYPPPFPAAWLALSLLTSVNGN